MAQIRLRKEYLAFEVDDVEKTLREVIQNGGRAYGEVVTAGYPNDIEAVFVYARDPGGQHAGAAKLETSYHLIAER